MNTYYKLLMKTLLLVLSIIINIRAYTQYNIEWEKYYGTSLSDRAYSLCSTSDNCYIAAGCTDGEFPGFIDSKWNGSTLYFNFWISKIDTAGNTIWAKAYGGEGVERFNQVIETNDESYVAVGYSSSRDFVKKERSSNWIVKFNSVGDTIWSKSFIGGEIVDILETNDSNLVFVHEKNRHYCIVTLNRHGELIWSKSYSKLYYSVQSDKYYSHCFPTSFELTNDGGYIISGKTSHDTLFGGIMHLDYWILRLDENGDSLWSKSYGGSENEFAFDIIQTQDNNYVVLGTSTSNDGDVGKNYGYADIWIIKLDQNGEIIWNHVYGYSGWESCYQLLELENKNLFILGSHGSNSLIEDSWLLKLDPLGEIIDQYLMGGDGKDQHFAFELTTDNGLLLIGSSNSNQTPINRYNKEDIWLTKLNLGYLNSSNISQNEQTPSIYPNPTDGNFTISNTNRYKFIEIYNTFGIKIHDAVIPFNSPEISIKLDNLDSCMLLVRLVSQHTDKIIPIIIQK